MPPHCSHCATVLPVLPVLAVLPGWSGRGSRCLVVDRRSCRLPPLWPYQLHFLDQAGSTTQLFRQEEHVADVYHNVSTDGRIVVHVAHDAIPSPVGLPELPPEVWLVPMKQTGT